MLIELDHPQFRSVELLAGTLTIHFMQGEARTLQENVLDVVLTLQDDELRIVAFLDQAYAWCYRGKRDLQSERLELSHPYAGGGQLVNDGQGHSHLFYF